MIQHEKNDPSYDIHTDEGLSRLVSVLDAHKRFKMHQAIWWNTDSPLPLKTATPSTGVFKLAVPIVWRSAPMDILSGMLTQQVNSWHGYPTLEGKVLKDYMTSRKFITDLRRFTPPFTICRDPQVSEGRRNANILLGDRPSKTKDIIVSWRSDYADLLFSPIAGTNVYARVIWLDPALKEAPQEVLNWVVYHEFCIIVASSLVNGKPKKTMMTQLEARFPGLEMAQDIMDSEGWRFTYDMRTYELRKAEDSRGGHAQEKEGPEAEIRPTFHNDVLGCGPHDVLGPSGGERRES